MGHDEPREWKGNSATKIVPTGREKTTFFRRKTDFFVFFKKGGFGGVAEVGGVTSKSAEGTEGV